jgi:hypothetical protein
VARFLVNDAPTVDAGGPYSVDEGSSVTLTASGADANGDALTYAWDLDGNGSFETAGQSVSYTAVDGPASPTVKVRASDGAASTTDDVTIAIANVAPTATLVAPASSSAGFPFELSLTGATDPSTADTAAGFQYAFDCGDGSGYGAFSASSTATCATSSVGPRTVHGTVKDKDGGSTEYTATVMVVVTFDSLCALTRQYASKPGVATAACKLLENAEKAKHPFAREALLFAYRVVVSASTGNRPSSAFTPVEGATLIELSRAL